MKNQNKKEELKRLFHDLMWEHLQGERHYRLICENNCVAIPEYEMPMHQIEELADARLDRFDRILNEL